MKLLKELLITETDNVEGDNISSTLSVLTSKITLNFINENNITNINMTVLDESVIKNVAKKTIGLLKNPIVAGIASVWAIDTYKKYKNKLQNTVRFHSTNSSDRKVYEKIVADLMKTGHYKKIKAEYADGGYLWELQRKD